MRERKRIVRVGSLKSMVASPPSRGIGSGSVVAGRYEIRDALGAGGMATVFRAHDRALDVSVALKVLKASPARDPELAHRFRSEIKLAWRVRHRNVCGIHEYGEDGDLLYISMELVEGKDLKRLLREEGPLAWEQAYDVAIQIAEGLEAIHEAGVIHRDLKPANITRDARGLVRLMDFGIAKVWGEDSGGGMTGTGRVVGSPEYMSPEQVRGTSVDFRSDLYALGLVIYELFTGRVPFRGHTPAAAMMRRLDEDPDWEGPAARQIPAAALPILRKALAREPGGRYTTCGEILADLRAARAALSRQTTDEVGHPDEPETATGPPRQAPAPPVPIFSREAQARLLVPPLVKAAGHADRSVRLGAVEALGRLGGDGLLVAPASRLAAEALEKARRDEDERVRAAAVLSLARFERPAPPPPVPVPPVRARPAPKPSQAHDRTDTDAPPPAPEPGPLPRQPKRLAAVIVLVAITIFALVLWRRLTTTQTETGGLPVLLPGTTLASQPSPSRLPEPPEPTLSPSLPPTKPGGLPTMTAPARPPSPRTRSVVTTPARTTLASQPSPSPSPEPPEPAPSPSSPPEPLPTPETVSAVPSTPPPTVTQTPAPIVPPACLSCPVPEAARVLCARLGLSRAVRLGVHVSETGDVLRVDYLVGPSSVRDTITQAALRWRYRPARRGETPVAAYVKVDLEL